MCMRLCVCVCVTHEHAQLQSMAMVRSNVRFMSLETKGECVSAVVSVCAQREKISSPALVLVHRVLVAYLQLQASAPVR